MCVYIRDKKKAYVVFIILFYFWILKDLIEKYVSIVGLADELFALLAIPIAVLNFRANNMRIQIKKHTYIHYLILIVVLGLTGNIIYEYQNILKVALPDMYLCIKFWLAIYVSENIFCKLDIKLYNSKIYRHVKGVTTVLFILLILDYVVGGITEFNNDYKLRAIQLFYGHPSTFAAACIFLLAILTATNEKLNMRDKHTVLLLILLMSTWRSKAIAAIVSYGVLVYLIIIKNKTISFSKLCALGSILIMIAWEKIQYYFFSSMQSDSARYNLLEKAVYIANDYFPLGTGFGTFASYYSGIYYSPLYYIYDLSDVNGLRIGKTWFVSDSYWPMILGQFGWIGLIAMIVVIANIIKQIQVLRNINKHYYLSAIFLITYLLISSTAEAAFVHSIAIPMAMWLGILLVQKNLYGNIGRDEPMA